MIIGQNYIFVAVPKVASTSLRTAIVQEPYLFQHDPYIGDRIPGIMDFHSSHVPLCLAAKHVDVTERLKVGFVRNPFDRFVSFCSWSVLRFQSKSDSQSFSFKDRPQKFMEMALRLDEVVRNRTTMIWEQHDFLSLESGKIAADFIGRFETLQESYDELCEKLNFKKRALPIHNVSQHKDYRHYYTTELVDKVAEYYKRDIKLFGYKFE